jgi:coniferyl-aldehyde dehydrogenase
MSQSTVDIVSDTQGKARGNLTTDEMKALLERQKAAHLRDGPPSAALRIDRINRAIGLLVDYADEIAAALNEDFGNRSLHQSKFTDVASSITPLKHARKNLTKWMKTDRRSAAFPLNLLGARARLEYQPLGVIGIISPWNFPVQLTFGPLADVLAAGNRCIIKPSEFTPATSELMARMIREAFSDEEIAVVTGGAETGAAFSSLPFDHLLFTGATSVAKHVMRAAAENLVPVTLELGGKSPVLVGESADVQIMANRVMFGKTLNAGQICLAPDYLIMPKEKTGQFVEAATSAVAKMYPTLKNNPDYTSIINQRHYDRLQGYIADAKSKGAEIVEINPAHEDFEQQPHHRIPPTLILNPTDDMAVMQDEIFGPILPVKTYTKIDEAIDYVNDHPRPLGLYYFGSDQAEERKVLDSTTSGGVSINEVVFHVAQDDLPFGGVGPSGMGAYHGKDGFDTFSHRKAVFTAPKKEVMAMVRPPWGPKIEKMMGSQIKR